MAHMGVSFELNGELCAGGKGPRDLITDVPGVRVGHVTLCGDSPDGPLHTGVTAIVPPGDCFADKLSAAAYVSNGFGKSMGLVQVDELGSLETPILMTNTLSCGACYDALVRHALDRHPRRHGMQRRPDQHDPRDGRHPAARAGCDRRRRRHVR